MGVTRSYRTQTELYAALARLDLRLRRAVDGQRDVLIERARDPFRGLYISDGDVDELLANGIPPEAAEQCLDGPVSVLAPGLARIAERFGLDTFEQEALLICLAPDVDLRYERLYAYLQDDVTRRRPSVDLILRLLSPTLDQAMIDRFALGPNGRLLREGLLVPCDENTTNLPLLARPLRVDERILEFILGSAALDARLTPFGEVIEPGPWRAFLDVPGAVPERLAELIGSTDARYPTGPVVYLRGTPGSARLATVRTAGRRANRPIVLIDLAALFVLGKPPPAQALTLATREALLRDAVLTLDGFDLILGEDEPATLARNHLRQLLTRRSGPTLLLGEARWEPAAWLPEARAMRVDLPSLGPSARVHLWREQLDGRLPADEVTDLAARFRLDGDAIQAVIASAQLRANWRGADEAAPADFRAAAAAIAAPPLEGLAKRVEPRYGWDDIVLPADALAQLRELCARARHATIVLEQWGFGRKHARRGGVTALFAGQPGTGKTMAAEIVAGALGLELYRIDLSAVVSKYIGETEKNLERIFRAADRGDAVLLFDEADAIFGKRSEVRDAHDRYANVETAYLLQRLEAYDGLAILTTNLRGNIDEAFVRRLDFVLEFPMPEEAERLAIWRLALPPEAPLGDDLDLTFLARKFRLSGGHIRNIALAAGFLAAADGGVIAMRQLARATRREYQKIGKMVAPADFEQYFAFLKDG